VAKFSMPLYTDQLSRKIELSARPRRIISVVPSQTELLYELGLDDEVIGITKFCVHPKEWFKTKIRIGGTKRLNLQKIKELQPDLIVANKEENRKEEIEELEKEFPVWISDVHDLSSAYVMINSLGKIVNREKESQELINKIELKFHNLSLNQTKIRTAYLIWKDPYLTVGKDTFIHQMLLHAGFENVFSDKTRYPRIEINDLVERDCDLLLLSSEPYPFKQIHIGELQPLVPNTKILLADGELFSWYGSRMLKAPSYFQKLHAIAIQ
jgi:ABC-type Fe3+-hydroxamate transport system substrate-binding protein